MLEYLGKQYLGNSKTRSGKSLEGCHNYNADDNFLRVMK